MFDDKNVRLHLTKAAMRMETTGEDETSPVVAIGLVLEPLTPQLAKQLHPEIANHCFTREGKIRDDVGQLRLKLRHRNQMVTARMAADQTDPSATLRHVRFPLVTITKRGEAETGKPGKKSKTISPSTAVLRATISGLVDPREKQHRDFLMQRFGDLMLYTFDDEDQDLPFGHAGDDDDVDRDDEQPGLALEDRLSDANVAAAVQETSITLLPRHLKALTKENREEALAYVEAFRKAKADGVASVDYPQAPNCILAPPKSVIQQAVEHVREAAERKKRPRKPRGEFKNSPRLARRK